MSGQIVARSRTAAFFTGIALCFASFIVIAILSLASPLQWAIPVSLIVGSWYYRQKAADGLWGFTSRRTSNIGWWVSGFTVFFSLAGSMPTQPSTDAKSQTDATTANDKIGNKAKEDADAMHERMREYPEEFVELQDLNWSADFSIMELSLTLKNNSEFALKDFVIECEHSAPSGTVIDRNRREIFEVVEAGKSKRILNFNMGFIHSQAKSTACSITRAKLR